MSALGGKNSGILSNVLLSWVCFALFHFVQFAICFAPQGKREIPKYKKDFISSRENIAGTSWKRLESGFQVIQELPGMAWNMWCECVCVYIYIYFFFWGGVRGSIAGLQFFRESYGAKRSYRLPTQGRDYGPLMRHRPQGSGSLALDLQQGQYLTLLTLAGLWSQFSHVPAMLALPARVRGRGCLEPGSVHPFPCL